MNSDDISTILENWQYVPNDINVRLIEGIDGETKIQMRLDLGILQMYLDGRPDGKRPHQCDSYLSYYENKSQEKKKSTKNAKFRLSPMDCLNLQQETIQYYHRYLGLMKLGDYTRVARDTSRNLKVFDFVSKYSDNEDIIWSFEQYRPYVLMMNARSLASISLDKSNFDEALVFIEKGIKVISEFYEKNQPRIGSDRFEIEFLTQWGEEIRERKPLSERERITKELDRAIQAEEYERAAILRDQLRFLGRDI